MLQDKYLEERRLCISIVGDVFQMNWNIKQSPDTFFYGKGLIIDVFETFGYNDVKFSNVHQ